MKIGLISDTHDNLPRIEQAVRFFNRNKVDFILHAGDFIAPFSLNPFKYLKADWLGVFGNNDGDKQMLSQKSSSRIKEPPFFLTFDSRRIALTHVFQELEADIVIFGHTHKPEIKKTKDNLFINPGEAGCWLTGKSTVSILDPGSLSGEIFYL
ncbi:MAG: metallophosphoesterase [Candidatus Omnitrophica bacterium]|nr:metallophosphoesterase [Candidatus Omnitrophota bacterium]